LRINLAAYCVVEDLTELLQQWDTERNGPLSPETITYGSRRKVWWKCDKGHSWQAAVYTRTTSGTGCPYCIGKKPYPGCNDLESQRPDLAAQWHPSKNGSLTPSKVTLGSHRAVWWTCDKGHEWQAAVKTRVNGCGCPVCAGRATLPGENDLATIAPELAPQWHPTKNGSLTPQDVVAGSGRKVWWKCEKDHEWQAVVSSRVRGAGCPVCAGRVTLPGENDLATAFPNIAEQWHPTRNGSLTPTQVTSASNRKVWWKCPQNHDYQAMVAARTLHGSGCPYCAGVKVLVGFNDLATLEPKVAEQWHPTLNGNLTPEQVTAGSHRMAWWVCPEGHIWKTVIYSRAGPMKTGCPICAGRSKSAYVKRYAEILNHVNPAVETARK
jgi:hypothetical protein